MKKGYTKTKQADMPKKFEQAKKLFGLEMSPSGVAEFLKIGGSTAALFKIAKTFEEYKALRTEQSKRRDEIAQSKIQPLSHKLVEKVETLEKEFTLNDVDELVKTLKQTNVLLGELTIELRSQGKPFWRK